MFRALSGDTICNRLETFDTLSTHLFGYELGRGGVLPQVYLIETYLPKTAQVMARIAVSRQLGDSRNFIPARAFEQTSSLGQKYASNDWIWTHFHVVQRTAKGDLPSDLEIARLIYPELK